MTVILRPACLDEAVPLARLGAETFSETFAHLYDPADLQAFLEGSHTAEAVRARLKSGNELWLVAEREGDLLAYAVAGPCELPHPEADASQGELKRLYVRARAQNLGLGARLMQQAITWLENQFHGALWLGVWSENYGAQRFYQRYGFDKVGEYGFPVGQQIDREFIFRRPAPASNT
ncbi:MAG: GNAT family N-acetyltransferase [Asticcacaulis sp.]